MNDLRNLLRPAQFADQRTVANIADHQFGVADRSAMPELQRIEHHNLALVGLQHAHRVRADVASTAGDENCHKRSSFVRNQSIMRVKPSRSEVVGSQP